MPERELQGGRDALPLDLVAEGERAMRLCNACRYCEGFCAVFPALERRLDFGEADLTYLANLCHNCGECHHACPYAPPHEFDLRLSRTLARIRGASYRKFARPRALAGLLAHGGVAALASALAGALLVLGAVLALLWLRLRRNPALADPAQSGLDVGFLALLGLTSLSGLLLMALRQGPAMGTLLVAHLGLVLGLFVTMPYGKFVHATYRYAALVRYALEQRRPRPRLGGE
ncbi:MAG TPA: hypothetical protein VLD85_01950 [Anaeromyxobacteraceae bacterium]|nr:hypothetical protein [Anaeromyxobacteraceae bacterium]